MFSYFSQKKKDLTLHANCDNLHGVSDPVCGKNKKNINLSSAELA